MHGVTIILNEYPNKDWSDNITPPFYFGFTNCKKTLQHDEYIFDTYNNEK